MGRLLVLALPCTLYPSIGTRKQLDVEAFIPRPNRLSLRLAQFVSYGRDPARKKYWQSASPTVVAIWHWLLWLRSPTQPRHRVGIAWFSVGCVCSRWKPELDTWRCGALRNDYICIRRDDSSDGAETVLYRRKEVRSLRRHSPFPRPVSARSFGPLFLASPRSFNGWKIATSLPRSSHS